MSFAGSVVPVKVKVSADVKDPTPGTTQRLPFWVAGGDVPKQDPYALWQPEPQ